VQDAEGGRQFVCPRCDLVRPILCAGCGRAAFKNVRMGVTRAREEIEALAMRPVAELTAESDPIPDTVRVIVGTEAALHRVPSADVVVFLDLDSELFAPKFRAAEHTLGLIARAAKLVSPVLGSGARQGRIVVQTRVPEHEVVRAMVLGDPGRCTEIEMGRRASLRLPPFVSFAEVSGAGAAEVAASLRSMSPGSGESGGFVEVAGPQGGPYLVRANSPEALADALAECDRPVDRVRVEIDPLRV
jgi:primosomal protein N' (replication factor Y) (superfamily II helicase)